MLHLLLQIAKTAKKNASASTRRSSMILIFAFNLTPISEAIRKQQNADASGRLRKRAM
jgi:hypothetical protein